LCYFFINWLRWVFIETSSTFLYSPFFVYMVRSVKLGVEITIGSTKEKCFSEKTMTHSIGSGCKGVSNHWTSLSMSHIFITIGMVMTWSSTYRSK
jgi:hypothetical protein